LRHDHSTFWVRTVDEKRRNRHETRTSPCSTQTPASLDAMGALFAAGRSSRSIVHAFQPHQPWRTSAETSFICATAIDANALLSAVRMHWGSKISFTTARCHATRRCSRIRKNPGVFARIRSFATTFPVQSIRHNPARPLRRRSPRSQIHIFYDLQQIR